MTARHVNAVLMAAVLVLSGCSRKITGYEPAPSEAQPPDLKAWEGFLYWGSFPIGARTPGGSASIRSAAPGASLARGVAPDGLHMDESAIVVVGTGCLPAVRQSAVGSFPDYRIHFYINDELWWDRASSSVPWSDVFGMPWVPPDTGLYTIRIVLDATNRYEEIDETNNEISFQVRVIQGDLVAGMTEVVEWRNGYPYNNVRTVHAGTPLQIVTWSHAWGRYENHHTVFEVNGTPLMDRRGSLNGGTLFSEIQRDTIPFTPSQPGSYTFRRVVDPEAAFPDRDRSNNESSITLTVTP